jgi:AcrR family transcriptional regulator
VQVTPWGKDRYKGRVTKQQSAQPSDAVQAAPRSRMAAAERRVLILESALQIFAQRGYDGAKVADIASAAGVTKAVVYDHFSSKRDIHVELIRSETARVMEAASGAFEAATGEFAKLRAVTDALFAYAEKRPFVRLFLQPSGTSDPVIAKAQADAEWQATQVLAAMILVMRPAADPTRADMAAAVCRGGLNALAAWWEEHRAVSRAEVVDLAVGVLWSGLPSVPEHGPLLEKASKGPRRPHSH